jgi:hypothetical protein
VTLVVTASLASVELLGLEAPMLLVQEASLGELEQPASPQPLDLVLLVEQEALMVWENLEAFQLELELRSA